MISRVLAAVLSGGLVFPSGMAVADAAAPFPEFSARRVKPPAAGARKRITVQIAPSEVQAAKPPAPETDPEGSQPEQDESPGQYPWFWKAVSADMTAAGPARLGKALAALDGKANVAAPRLQSLQEIVQTRGILILRSTIGTRVSPALVLAVIAVESGGRADAVSPAGASGLMQLMPDTAARFGVTDSLKPEDNIAGGVKYLDWLIGKFGGDPILALAGYNAGEGAVRDYLGVPPFAETRDYVPRVLAAFQVARGMCKTPPELISDGCVFMSMN